MKKILVVVLVIVSFTSFAQLPVAFEMYRHHVQDTARWRKINQFVAQNEFEKAKQEAYEYAKSCLKDNNLQEFLFVLNQVSANINIIGKDMISAMEMLKFAEENVKSTGDTLSVEYAILMKFIATTHFYNYEDKQALDYFYKGYAIARQLKNVPDLELDLTMNVGNSYVNLGAYQEAIPYLDTALNYAIKYKNPVAFMLTSQAFGYIASREDVYLALNFFPKVEKVAKGVNIEENHYNKYLAHICNSMAALYTESHQEKKALEYSKKALKYFQKTSVSDIYLGAAILSNYLKERSIELDFASTELLKDSILAYTQANKIDKHPVSIPIYTAIIEYYHSQNLSDSLNVYKSIVEDIISSAPQKDYDMAVYYGKMASLSSDVDTKIAYLDNSVSVITNDSLITGDNFEPHHFKHVIERQFYLSLRDVFLAYSKIAKTKFEKHKNIKELEKSIKYLQLCLNGHEYFAANTSNKKTGLLHSKEIYHISNLLIDDLREAYQITNERCYLDDIFEVDSKSKAFFVHYSYDQLVELDGYSHNQLIKLIMKQNKYEIDLRAAVLSEDEALQDRLRDSIIDVNFDIVRQQISLNSANKTQVIPDVNVDSIQRVMAEESLMLSYFLSENYLYTIFISKNHFEHESKALTISFKRNIKNALRSIKSGQEISKEVNDELYQVLFSKLDKYSNKKHLIIIPHQNLSGFPLEVIKDNNNKYLIEKYSFSYHYSVPMWLESVKNTSKDIKSIDLFAPVFDEGEQKESTRNLEKYNYFEKLYLKDRSSLNTLKYSMTELNSIAEISQKQGLACQKYLKKDANEFNFKNKIKQSDILHISTHGYVNKRQAQLSGLFFWPSEKEDGYLFNDEILNLDLNADLVVLSSCNSGSGILEGAEGQNSMQRKFIIMSVPNVMASLWKVHDEKTKDLMLAFYKHLLEGGCDYNKALQMAKQDCIKQGLLPIDWAGFILIGA
jgi:CHAT domain-containing protein